MGGHKKSTRGHSGNYLRGARGGKGGRNKNPELRATLGKGLDVPSEDLRKAGKKLEARKAKRDEGVETLRAAKALHRGAKAGSSGDRHALAVMALQAAKGHEQHAAKLQRLAMDAKSGAASGPDLSLRKYSKEFKAVIEQADVLLEVLDARDPLGSRLYEFELAIKSQYGDSKTIVAVLNKADMVPDADVVEAWVQYLGNENIDAIPFSATLATKRNPRFEGCVQDVFRALRRIGRVDDSSSARKSLTVGVIGYPNVGKSSTINALKGKAVVGVGNTPGFTTGNTEVDLRGDIKIIDCPGVVVKGVDGADVVLRNATKLSEVEDPLVVVERAIERSDMAIMCAVYGVPVPSGLGNPTAEFLRAVALKRGRVVSGGQLELAEAARIVLKDWLDGRIVHYTVPPQADEYTVGAHTAEVGDAPEMIQQMAQVGPAVLPSIVVVPPEGAAPATWQVPETRKHAGKIKYNPLDTSSDEDEEGDYDSDGVADA